ncbi:SRPBCC family protein [Cyclobacterium jeungdonense]|uniref:SRPBCC family protein n=1 Tax=Cyclobacterium jeungdonense TaxID=708087 RepID=A0ABT8C6N9_9BACT|nr:SRPBCC family protein [Cyclobacterium jeungdonense]MDN3688463.1 SRPBCC family protein [Cyclobacterium jeungdonense]
MHQQTKKSEKITVQAIIAAGSQKVWEYYTDPEQIMQWNFASQEWQCPRVKNELRVGGSFYARMEAKDGSFGFDYEAVYDEIRPEKFLSYALTDGRKVQVSFEEEGNQTMVTITFDSEPENSTDMQRDGWQAILNNFKKHVEES